MRADAQNAGTVPVTICMHGTAAIISFHLITLGRLGEKYILMTLRTREEMCPKSGIY